MADDSRDTRPHDATSAPASGAAQAGPSEPPKKIPRGVVLGPDGKPCRSCTSFASWAAQTKSTLKKSAPPPECPPDVEALGRSSWTLLHSIAAQYPENPSQAQQSDLAGFVGLFAKLYPCWTCAEDFQGYITKKKPVVGSRGEFGQWLCDAHNDVNRKLGKPEFDCKLWEERWRTGWKDGRCD
ncbi:related to erv1 protein, mitochondrial precursor [Cephalotrichum gorgonifer]|uniref:Sulfhydryl oxidase n=1 Tax=Cephalotrichum gorgonifer TaxID=2041049 RepID=A0AAE8SUH8_9PEZI|nr:related to erv1 protein, mitochondrial precursor [Cephalotrichum gorgonifer]